MKWYEYIIVFVGSYISWIADRLYSFFNSPSVRKFFVAFGFILGFCLLMALCLLMLWAGVELPVWLEVIE